MDYTIEFIGRLKGAIGIQYTIVDTVTADNEPAAVLALYEKYDNVHNPIIIGENGQRLPRHLERLAKR